MIRIAVEADVPAILSIYASYVTETTITFEYDVPTQEEFFRRFREITAEFPWLVWEEGGTILGYAYACRPFARTAYRWCAEASVYLHPDARRRGIGTALYEALEDRLRRQGFQVVYALVTSANAASLAFHRHLGYTPCAQFSRCGFKHGTWYSVTWLEKQLAQTAQPENFPEPPADL